MFVLLKTTTGNVLKNRWAGRLMFHSLSLCSDDKPEIDPRCYIYIPLSFCLVMVEILLFLFPFARHEPQCLAAHTYFPRVIFDICAVLKVIVGSLSRETSGWWPLIYFFL